MSKRNWTEIKAASAQRTKEVLENRKKRGTIKGLSYGSTKRARHTLRNILPRLTHEIGLTYPRHFEKDGRKVKAHLHKIKMRLAYRDINMFWFMEFQSRGAAHFHALLDKPITVEELRKMWYQIVGSQDSRHLRKGAYAAPIRDRKAMGIYLTQYLTKQEQKTVPAFFLNSGRYWGYSKCLLDLTTHIIIGATKDVRSLYRDFRPFRRYQESKQRTWKRRKTHKNRFATFRPGEYLTLFQIRPVVEFLNAKGYDVGLLGYLLEEEGPGAAGFSPRDGAFLP